MKKRLAILGSTGSIGTQTLEVVDQFPDKFEIEVLTANNNIQLLIEQARKFQPNTVVIGNEEKYTELSDALEDLPIKVFAGEKAIAEIVSYDSIDIVLTALVGYSGLIPTINAIKAKKRIALANKETLVVAGDIIKQLVIKNNVSIIPVDSEHSAIFQCLTGEEHNAIEKIYLTASGGPFRDFSMEQLMQVKREDALKHPNWDMGNKITIDSATLINKGLEAIEAKWLFNVDPDQIEVIIHPQSIVHSIVQFEDGSMKAQMGLPDMKLPILYALNYPERLKANFPRFNFMDYPQLSFRKPDTSKFPGLDLAYESMRKGGNMPCILNASNEIAVDAFLNEKIRFLDIPKLIETTLTKVAYISKPVLDDYQLTDKEARDITLSLIK